MSSAPPLLGEDGKASIASALMMSHHGFRRDIARFAVALRTVAAGDTSRVAALQEEWPRYRGTLHAHHQSEDSGLFPSLRDAHATLAAGIDQLTSDHRRIDPLLDEGDRAFAGLPATVAAAASVVERLAALLDGHLASEEAQVIPFLRGVKTFPPPASEAEAQTYAEGFAWASHGIAPEVLDRLNDLLPTTLTAKLPAARAAFAERHERVWGPTPPSASRTAIPDWLPGG